jgi:hypothetical protein
VPERAIGVTDEASAAGVADYRLRERSVDGTTVGEQYLIFASERVRSFLGMATTFRIPGAGTANQIMATLFNKTGSGVLIAVRYAAMQTDYVGTASGTIRDVSTSRLTVAPTTGTLHTPVAFDSAQTHNASVEFRGGASADGTASAITATPGTYGTHAFSQRNLGTPNRILMRDLHLTPFVTTDEPVVLREGEGVAFTGVLTASALNYIVMCCFGEFTLP